MYIEELENKFKKLEAEKRTHGRRIEIYGIVVYTSLFVATEAEIDAFTAIYGAGVCTPEYTIESVTA